MSFPREGERERENLKTADGEDQTARSVQSNLYLHCPKNVLFFFNIINFSKTNYNKEEMCGQRSKNV